MLAFFALRVPRRGFLLRQLSWNELPLSACILLLFNCPGCLARGPLLFFLGRAMLILLLRVCLQRLERVAVAGFRQLEVNLLIQERGLPLVQLVIDRLSFLDC